MAENTAAEAAGNAEKRNKTAADLMSELAALLDKDEKEKKEKKRSNKSVFFERCPTTGERVYFSKCRKQSKSRRSSTVPSASQPHDHATSSAGNVDDDINTGECVIITTKIIKYSTLMISMAAIESHFNFVTLSL